MPRIEAALIHQPPPAAERPKAKPENPFAALLLSMGLSVQGAQAVRPAPERTPSPEPAPEAQSPPAAVDEAQEEPELAQKDNAPTEPEADTPVKADPIPLGVADPAPPPHSALGEAAVPVGHQLLSSGGEASASDVIAAATAAPLPQEGARTANTQPPPPAEAADQLPERQPVAPRTDAATPRSATEVRADASTTSEALAPESQARSDQGQVRSDGDRPHGTHHTQAQQPHTPQAAHPACPAAQAQPSAAAVPVTATPAAAAPAAKPTTTSTTQPIAGLTPTNARQAALNRLTAQAPMLRQSIERHAFVPQAGKALALALKQGDGTVSLKLTPENLGTLKVEVTMQNGDVTAKLQASSESARQLLIESQPSLRAALEARGLSVERIEVQPVPQAAPAHDPPATGQDRPQDADVSQDGRSANPQQQPSRDDASHHERELVPSGESSTWTPPAPEITFATDHGGTYRLHLDAVA